MFLLNPYDFQPISWLLEGKLLTFETLAVMPDPQTCWARCKNWMPPSSKKTPPKTTKEVHELSSFCVRSLHLTVSDKLFSLGQSRVSDRLTDGVCVFQRIFGERVLPLKSAESGVL